MCSIGGSVDSLCSIDGSIDGACALSMACALCSIDSSIDGGFIDGGFIDSSIDGRRLVVVGRSMAVLYRRLDNLCSIDGLCSIDSACALSSAALSSALCSIDGFVDSLLSADRWLVVVGGVG